MIMLWYHTRILYEIFLLSYVRDPKSMSGRWREHFRCDDSIILDLHYFFKTVIGEATSRFLEVEVIIIVLSMMTAYYY